MKEDLNDLVAAVNVAFDQLRDRCPHRADTDCGHPDIDFSRMMCSPCNCPLLDA